jgi:transposase
MESMLRVLAQSGMTVAEVARVIGEHPQRVWNVLLHHVERAHGRMGLEKVRVGSVDEVCRKRGHNDLTIVSEPKQDGQPTRVLLAVEGRDSKALGQFADHLRRRERRAFPEELKKVRWALLKGDDKLREADRETRRRVCRGKLQTGKAFNHLDALREVMKETDAAVAEKDLKGWCGWVSRSRIPEMVKVSRTIRKHWDGIVAYLKTRVNNGPAEALNGIIQTVKRKSRGFRTVRYFTAMIYLVASRLKFDLPDPLPSTHTKSDGGQEQGLHRGSWFRRMRLGEFVEASMAEMVSRSVLAFWRMSFLGKSGSSFSK